MKRLTSKERLFNRVREILERCMMNHHHRRKYGHQKSAIPNKKILAMMIAKPDAEDFCDDTTLPEWLFVNFYCNDVTSKWGAGWKTSKEHYFYFRNPTKKEAKQLAGEFFVGLVMDE